MTTTPPFGRAVLNSALRLWLLSLSLMLVACSSTLDDYRDTSPELRLAEFFNGKLIAYGIVQDRSGKVLRRFQVDMVGRWQGEQGVLEEDFVYDDGERQRRVWHLQERADGSLSGTAGDVVGQAEGRAEGFALHWYYTLEVPVDGRIWQLNFDDWMYLLDEHRLINRTEMRKWGFKVGEVTLVIEKQK